VIFSGSLEVLVKLVNCAEKVNFAVFLKAFSDRAVAPFDQGYFVAYLNSSSVVPLNQQFFGVEESFGSYFSILRM
jgi:hypothetical protein